MGCFGCCGDDDMHKAPGHGPYMTPNSAGEHPISNPLSSPNAYQFTSITWLGGENIHLD